jgi:hypothetical protein
MQSSEAKWPKREKVKEKEMEETEEGDAAKIEIFARA